MRDDFQTAFADLAPDVEWELLPSLPDTGVLKGRDAVMHYFSSVRDVGDWHTKRWSSSTAVSAESSYTNTALVPGGLRGGARVAGSRRASG